MTRPSHIAAYFTLGLLLGSQLAWAHGGGLDRYGCHNERRTGGYHCHRAGYTPPNRDSGPTEMESPDPRRPSQLISPNAPELVAPQSIPATPSYPSPLISDLHESDRKRREERAAYSISNCHYFDPAAMSAHATDERVRDKVRAKFWSEKGYVFNPGYMSACAMDQKVKDIERAIFWQSHGHQFNPDYMSAYAMDQKVKDIKRAAYWRKRGFDFNPQYMSAYAMDREVEHWRKAKRDR